MKQVNFKELNVEVEIDVFQNIDMRKDIANAIHRRAVTVPLSDLARKIYYSDQAVEINDEDYGAMMSIISGSFALVIKNAVERSATDVIKEDEEV